MTFRAKIRAAMPYDNATLLYEDGMAVAVDLDRSLFSKAARQIFAHKRAAMKKGEKIGKKLSLELSSNDITYNHCPGYVNDPYGVLRIYAPTTPGKRSPRTTTPFISPSKDLDLDLNEIERESKERHQLSD